MYQSSVYCGGSHHRYFKKSTHYSHQQSSPPPLSAVLLNIGNIGQISVFFYLTIKRVFLKFKGIVSRDWGRLQMFLLDRYKVLDIPA
jgi:hypothetical protein